MNGQTHKRHVDAHGSLAVDGRKTNHRFVGRCAQRPLLPEGGEASLEGRPPQNPILKTAVFFHFCFPVRILFVFQCGSVLSHSVMSDSFVIPWTVAHQVPLFMGFSRQEYWSGLPGPPPDSGIHPHFLSLLHWQASFLPLEPPEKPSPHTFIHNQKLRQFH